jgi:hypothetical protein
VGAAEAASDNQFVAFFGGLVNSADRGAGGFLLNINGATARSKTNACDARTFYFLRPMNGVLMNSASRLPT